jgi:hypothetical protein
MKYQELLTRTNCIAANVSDEFRRTIKDDSVILDCIDLSVKMLQKIEIVNIAAELKIRPPFAPNIKKRLINDNIFNRKQQNFKKY